MLFISLYNSRLDYRAVCTMQCTLYTVHCRVHQFFEMEIVNPPLIKQS